VAERLKYKLYLRSTFLSPPDFLCVSFFLSIFSGKEIRIDLYGCTIGDLGAEWLSKYLHVDNSMDYVSKIAIDLARNDIHEEGALHIARMLCFIEHLNLSYNPIGDTGAALISKAVREFTTLKTLILCGCVITSRGAVDLSRTLTRKGSMEKLDIGGNNLGDEGISHVAEALKHNKKLKELWISGCGMTDKGATSLVRALTVNNSLKRLHIGGRKGGLTEDGLSTIARSLTYKSLFVKLAIPYSFGANTADRLNCKVNETRKRSRIPPIEIEGEYIVYVVRMYHTKHL
jgi:hypothetical protein